VLGQFQLIVFMWTTILCSCGVGVCKDLWVIFGLLSNFMSQTVVSANMHVQVYKFYDTMVMVIAPHV
jgi:hypothetical protein